MSRIEYELRVLNININDMVNILNDLGASLVDSSYQKRYVYDFKPVDPNRWIRLRTNGKKTTLTFKSIDAVTVDGTREMEIEVDSFNETNDMLNVLGYTARGKQENYRIRFDLDGVEVDIDIWPHIPPFLEIEGKTAEEVLSTLTKLGIDDGRATALGVLDIYEDIYKIPDANKNLSFSEPEVKYIETLESLIFKEEEKYGRIK